MFFFAITWNLYWEILSKNLVTCKRWDGGSLKNLIFREGVTKNQYIGGNS